MSSILHLQRTIGNQALRQLIEAKPQVNTTLHVERTIERMGNTKPLEGVLRSRAESSLGVTLSDVRVHRGPAADRLLAARGVEALAVGPHIVAGSRAHDASPILAHEVAHAAAQSRVGGATDAAPRIDATSERDADLGAVAILAGVSHRMTPLGGRAEQHFASNEHAWLGDSAADSGKFLVKPGEPGERDKPDIWMTSGEVNALADYFGSLEDMQQASHWQLQECLRLLEEERASPGSVTTQQWDAATGGKYSEISLDNSAHFGVSDPALVPVSGTAGRTNASTWEAGHRQALRMAAGLEEGGMSQGGLTNAFVEHYLVDAFSAGHLFNKDDAMALGKANLDALPPDDLIRLLDWVADPVFAQRREVIQQYQVRVGGEDVGRWETFGPFLFRQFLHQAYAVAQPVVLNGLVKSAHDSLSANGVWVENAAHEPWLMRGDEHLADPDQGLTRQYCMEALEVGRANLQAAAAQGKNVNVAALVARVRGLFPRPTVGRGTHRVREAVAAVTDPRSGMRTAMVEELSAEIRSLMEEAVDQPEDSVRRDPGIPADDFEDHPPSGPNPLPDGQYYYVKPGDWLSKIAETFYHDPMKYPILFEANKDPERAAERGTDVVSDPDVIEEGWRLFIPELPAP